MPETSHIPGAGVQTAWSSPTPSPPAVRASVVAREASQLLEAFAIRTGLDGPASHARRYVWTDACAVMAWIELHAQSGFAGDLARASRLVEQVHATLARHRYDDARSGWLSGLDEREAALAPTAGGLRIGKPLPERRADEPFNEHLEWDRDGQYLHYNIRWMLALDALARATGESRHLRNAILLADRSVRAFAHGPDGRGRLYWKMSIDLTRPLVASMGQHDALDGFVALSQLRSSARRLAAGWGESLPALDASIARLGAMCDTDALWTTADPLGIGGLLADAAIAIRLLSNDPSCLDTALPRLAAEVLVDAQRGLAAFEAAHAMRGPAPDRLAFRELGLAGGLRRCGGLSELVRGNRDAFGSKALAGAIVEKLEAIERREPLATRIEDSWRGALAQATAAWQAHRDINEVMLAESLALREARPSSRW